MIAGRLPGPGAYGFADYKNKAPVMGGTVMDGNPQEVACWPPLLRRESFCVQFESFVILLAFFEVNVLGSIKKEWIDGTLILD